MQEIRQLFLGLYFVFGLTKMMMTTTTMMMMMMKMVKIVYRVCIPLLPEGTQTGRQY